MSERRIVFINQATGYLTIDIINAFADTTSFDRVELIAGSVRVQDVPLSGKVKWIKIAKYDRGSPLKKLFSWLTGTIQIAWLLLTRYRKFEIFYITVPPFAYLLSLVLPQRFSILVYDIYPDALKIYGIGKRNPVYRIWSAINKGLFKRAHKIFTLGEGMKRALQQYNSSGRDIMVVSNWSGLLNLREVNRTDNGFLHRENLSNKFVVQYSGNIGYTHNVEVLLSVAELLQDVKDLFFLIIGRGDRYKFISDQVHIKKLNNCRVLPFQPDEILNEVLSAADLAVVVLDDRVANVSIPSKMFNLQAVGVPVLGITKRESELDLHLQTFKHGVSFESHQVEEISAFIRSYQHNTALQREWKVNSKIASGFATMKNAFIYRDEYCKEPN